jgi:hypothetical protein
MGRFFIRTCAILAVVVVWAVMALVAAADYIDPGM